MRSEDWKFVYTCVHLTLQMPSSLVEETGWGAVSTSFLCTLTVCFRVGQHLFTATSWTAGVESLCVSERERERERERARENGRGGCVVWVRQGGRWAAAGRRRS